MYMKLLFSTQQIRYTNFSVQTTRSFEPPNYRQTTYVHIRYYEDGENFTLREFTGDKFSQNFVHQKIFLNSRCEYVALQPFFFRDIRPKFRSYANYCVCTHTIYQGILGFKKLLLETFSPKFNSNRSEICAPSRLIGVCNAAYTLPSG